MLKFISIAGALMAFAPVSFAADAKLTDPQIAEIAYAAGQIDIAAANQALQKTQNADVKQFAETMARDHATVNDQAGALLKKLNVTPQPSAVSEALAKQAEETSKRLEALNGAQFDKAYAENELAYHKAVNDALSKTLIPGSQNAELKSLLETGLKLFQGHQAHAEHLVMEFK